MFINDVLRDFRVSNQTVRYKQHEKMTRTFYNEYLLGKSLTYLIYWYIWQEMFIFQRIVSFNRCHKNADNFYQLIIVRGQNPSASGDDIDELFA